MTVEAVSLTIYIIKKCIADHKMGNAFYIGLKRLITLQSLSHGFHGSP